jgi:hypothetical protein
MVTRPISSAEASINSNAVSPGTYKLIRCDGSETLHQGKTTIRAIQMLIGCDCLDTVTIDRRRQTMFVDDTGMLDGKPVNTKATALYQAICHPGFPYSIHGDVVIVPAGGLA